MFDTLIDINNWSWRDLNAKPSACKADALPIELQPLYLLHLILRLYVDIFHPVGVSTYLHDTEGTP